MIHPSDVVEFVFNVSTLATLIFGYVAGIAFFYSDNVPTRVGGVLLALSAITAAVGLGALGWKIVWMGAAFFVVATVAFVYRHRPRWMPQRHASQTKDTSTEHTCWADSYRGLQQSPPKNKQVK